MVPQKQLSGHILCAPYEIITKNKTGSTVEKPINRRGVSKCKYEVAKGDTEDSVKGIFNLVLKVVKVRPSLMSSGEFFPSM